MSNMDGYTVCERLKANEQTRDIPVIFISALDETVDKVKGFEVGGMDYITKPFQPEEVLVRVKTHLILQRLRNHLEEVVEERTAELQKVLAEVQQLKDKLQAENIYFRKEIQLEHNFDQIIGHSKSLKYTLFRVEQVAPTDTTVLISGETGTGKELIAHAIHHASSRSERPLVKVNCAALPAHLIESELFGHEKGAFTGATTKQIGRFELADRATLFLDEVGELPLELQAKLLRVLQDGEFERLGNPRTIRVDVRVIAATNRNLEAEVRAGRFREDLYYRLNVYPLSVPPLRERLDDIPLLVQAFVQKLSKKLGKQIDSIPQKTMDALQQYAWPGNVRELENVIERAIITVQDTVLRVELPRTQPLSVKSHKPLNEMEREYILQVLEDTGWTIGGDYGAASILGLPPSTLRSRMQKLGIKRS
jgi:transcriptional regulator with GAF, ATPase, and Fis domain